MRYDLNLSNIKEFLINIDISNKFEMKIHEQIYLGLEENSISTKISFSKSVAKLSFYKVKIKNL